MRPVLAAFAAVFAFGYLLTASPVHAQTVIGAVERMRGEATRAQGNTLEALATGAVIFEGDVLKTGAETRLVLRMIDESVLTLGAMGEFAIDEMAFRIEPNGTDVGRQSLRYLAGVFRFVSGRVARAERDRFALVTPVATIGIRGTEFLGGELTVGMPPGESHYGFQIVTGAIEVAAPLGSVVLDEPGEGTFLPIAGDAAPTPVRQWTADEAAEAEAAVAF